MIYVSKFYWDNEIIEETLYLENRADFEKFNEDNSEPTSDFWIWEYKTEEKEGWNIWKCNDFVERYLEYCPAQSYYEEMIKQRRT